MSYRGQQHGQRTYTGKGFDNKNDAVFNNLEPVPVNRYSPSRDVACQQYRVPYSQVFVGGQHDNVRSHEVHLDNKDRGGFIDAAVLSQERRVQRENKAWSESYDRGSRTPARAKELRQRGMS